MATVKLDYFRGDEVRMCSFYRVPKAFELDERYKNASLEVKYLYCLMLDRVGLSTRNGWMDGGRVFIYFTLEDVKKACKVGKNKAMKVFREMETLNLIQRRKQGQGKPARIFVKNFIESGENTESGANAHEITETEYDIESKTETFTAVSESESAEYIPVEDVENIPVETIEESNFMEASVPFYTRPAKSADAENPPKIESAEESAAFPFDNGVISDDFIGMENGFIGTENDPVYSPVPPVFAHDEFHEIGGENTAEGIQDLVNAAIISPSDAAVVTALANLNGGNASGRPDRGGRSFERDDADIPHDRTADFDFSMEYPDHFHAPMFGDDYASDDWFDRVQTSPQRESGRDFNPGDDCCYSAFGESRLPKTGSQDFPSGDPNKNNKNNNDFINIESIYPARGFDFDADFGAERRLNTMDKSGWRKRIKENIDYGLLSIEHPNNMECIDNFLEIMVQTCASGLPTVRINCEDMSRDEVRKRFDEINQFHILYVLECLEKNKTHIRNIRAYILSSLFNAPTTMEAYYDAQVSRDMARDW